MSSYITREDQYSKPPHKKLKDRQIDRQNRLNSPPSSIYKSNCTTVYNGYGKGHSAGGGGGSGGGSGGGPGIKKTERRARSSPKSNDSDLQGNVQRCLPYRVKHGDWSLKNTSFPSQCHVVGLSPRNDWGALLRSFSE